MLPMPETLFEEVARRLDAIRADPERSMRYDRNGDGVIDDEEWEQVRRVVLAEVQTERARESTARAGNLQAEPVDAHMVELLKGRYELLQQIGQGGQAKTYLAIDGSSHQKVALKQLDLRRADNWKAIELFEREARVLEQLSHPSIPAYFDAFHLRDDQSGEEHFFLVQEFVDGQSLKELIDRGFRLDEEEVRDFLIELLEVLDYLHGLSPAVIHRDIKPSNIIRRPDGSLALIDFGAVQAVLPGEKGASTVVGTSGYMPLEQLMGRALPATDLYALGATVIHLLSHRHPADLPVRAMALQFHDFINVSPAFETLLEKMTAPHLEDRFSSASDLRRALDHLLPTSSGAPALPLPSSFQDPSKDSPAARTSSRQIPPFEGSPPPGSRAIIDAGKDSLRIEIPALHLKETGTAGAIGAGASLFGLFLMGTSLSTGEANLCCFGSLLLLIPLLILFPRFRKRFTTNTIIVDDRGLHLIQRSNFHNKEFCFEHRIPIEIKVGQFQLGEINGKPHYRSCLEISSGGKRFQFADHLVPAEMHYLLRYIRHALAAKS